MNIHEHQAKEILREYGAPTSNGVVIHNKDEIEKKIRLLKLGQMEKRLKEFILKRLQTFLESYIYLV